MREEGNRRKEWRKGSEERERGKRERGRERENTSTQELPSN